MSDKRGEKRPPENADQLRTRIDRGEAGDKVDFPDPAAAPLGTDDEAAGTPPTQARVATAAANEMARSSLSSRKPVKPRWLWAMAAAAILVIIAAFAAIFWPATPR